MIVICIIICLVLFLAGFLIWYFLIRKPSGNNGDDSNKAKANVWDDDKYQKLTNKLSTALTTCDKDEEICKTMIKNDNLKNCMKGKMSECVADYITKNYKYNDNILTDKGIEKPAEEGLQTCAKICFGVKGNWSTDLKQAEIDSMKENANPPIKTKGLQCYVNALENYYSPMDFMKEMDKILDPKNDNSFPQDLQQTLINCQKYF